MAVTITDLRNSGTPFNECDATTGWQGGPTVYTSDPNPVEATGCLGFVVSTTTANGYYVAGTGVDLSDSLVYVWVRPYGTMDTLSLGGVGIVLGDGTNRMAYYVGGSDQSGFRHQEGPVDWACFLLDTLNLPTGKATIAGSEGSMSWTAITDIGARFKTLSKALGNVENCWIDILRVGTEGLRITGGGSGTEGNFSEIATADRGTGNQAAYGICRELAAGVFGLQGPLTFGDDASTGSVDFDTSNETVAFEPPLAGIQSDRFWLKVVGNSTGTTSVVWTGCTFICPAGTGAALTATDANVDTLTISGCSFRGFEQGISFVSATTTGTHSITDCTFDGCGAITPGFLLQDGTFTGNTISNSTASATGALVLGSTGYVSGLDLTDTTFVSGGTGHAIYITQAGTYDFQDLVFSGYGADDTTNAAVYNNSGGSVTINAQDVSNLTVRNGTGASTTVNNSVTVKVVAVEADGTAVSGARVFLEEDPGGTDIFNGSDATSLTDVNGEVSTTYNYTSDQDVIGRVRLSSPPGALYQTAPLVGTIGSTGLTLTAVMIPDE